MSTVVSAIRRFGPLNTYAVDGLVALGFTFFAVLIFFDAEGAEAGFRDPDALSFVLLLLQTLPLTLRRRWPIAIFLFVFWMVAIYSAVGYPSNGAGKLATVLAFFTVIERTDMRTSLIVSLAVPVGLTVFYSTTREVVDNTFETALDATVAFMGAWIVGTFMRVRREQAERDAERLQQLQAERDAMTRLAIAQERSAIARELHDAVGHALNLIVIQAGAARRVFDSRPEKGAEALAAIETASRQALSDMDRMLGLLHEDGRGGPDSQSAPGVAELSSLIDQTREAGLDVELSVSGEPVGLPLTVDQSVYRIVQESLTNCLKHASGASSQVEVAYGDGAVELTISDNGPGPVANNRTGRGLIGMRERVRLFGGDFEAGRRTQGGFQVKAKIPFAAVKP